MLYRLQSKMPQSISTGCRHWNVQTREFCVQEKRGSCFRQNYENYLLDGNSSANTVHILGGCVLGTVCSTIWPKWLNLVWFSVNKYLFQSISRHGIWNLIWTSERKLRFSTLCQDCHQCCRVELGFQKSQISSDEAESANCECKAPRCPWLSRPAQPPPIWQPLPHFPPTSPRSLFAHPQALCLRSLKGNAWNSNSTLEWSPFTRAAFLSFSICDIRAALFFSSFSTCFEKFSLPCNSRNFIRFCLCWMNFVPLFLGLSSPSAWGAPTPR